MSATRESTLAAIRSALGREALVAPAREALSARTKNVPVHTRPAITGDLLTRLQQKLLNRSATIDRVATLADVPAAVRRFLAQHDLPPHVVCASAFFALDWPNDTIELHGGPARQDDTTSLTPCLAGVAETGNLVLRSGKETPTTLHFVPENHIVVLRRDQIVAHFEDVWVLLRRQIAEQGGLPRAINFVSGPSRTADVEQTIQLGAHGPRRLHVIVLG